MSKKPKVVVVTGASAGLGRATARRFAREGADVALIARGRDGLEEARREIEDLGRRALVLPLDVSIADDVESAAARVERELGEIDAWVNVAMTNVIANTWDVTAAEFERVTRVNYLGYVHGTLAALRRMRPRDRGTIVMASSALALRSIPLQAAYCASKHAIVGFTETLRTELLAEKSGVAVTMVHLPAMNTPQFDWARARTPRAIQPVPPIFQPEVGAEALVHAARHPRRAIAVGLSTVKSVQGNKLAPGLLDRYLAKKGFDAQQTDEPADPNRPDNLIQPVPGDFGAHGRFDARAKGGSAQLWVNTHRGTLALAAAAVVGLASWAALRAA